MPQGRTKRAQPHRQSAPPRPRVRRQAGPGRSQRVPATPNENEELMTVYRAGGREVQALYAACAKDEDRLNLLRALRAFQSAPNDPAALARWIACATALRRH